MKEFINDFEPLTDENAQIAYQIASPYGNREIELPNGDVLILGGDEIGWVAIGYTHHIVASFMHRCLDGVEHPQIRDQLEIRQRHVDWDRLELVMDVSSWDYGLQRIQYGEQHGFRIDAIYRVGDDEWIIAEASVDVDTCDMGNFGFAKRVMNSDGLFCDEASDIDFCQGFDETMRSIWLVPLTNAEIETGRIRCRKSQRGSDECE